MSIKAIFPQGQTHITVNGLHQWDYGQCLEIHADDLPTVFEVHFACVGETEAKVRSCSVVNGVGTVPIPDACLEHATPILAWIYAIDGTEGATVKTITLEVMVRAKPLPGEDIPVEVYDKYTEVITEMNGAVGALKDGSVVVGHALTADNATKADRATIANIALNADNATQAENADRAAQADNATKADRATIADRALNADNANSVPGAFPTPTVVSASRTTQLTQAGYYYIGGLIGNEWFDTVLYWDGKTDSRSSHFLSDESTEERYIAISAYGDVEMVNTSGGSETSESVSIRYAKLWG